VVLTPISPIVDFNKQKKSKSFNQVILPATLSSKNITRIIEPIVVDNIDAKIVATTEKNPNDGPVHDIYLPKRVVKLRKFFSSSFKPGVASDVIGSPSIHMVKHKFANSITGLPLITKTPSKRLDNESDCEQIPSEQKNRLKKSAKSSNLHGSVYEKNLKLSYPIIPSPSLRKAMQEEAKSKSFINALAINRYAARPGSLIKSSNRMSLIETRQGS